MSIASTTSKSGPYAGNGVTTLFAVGFACFAAADLNVVRTDASGADVTLVLNTDYSVSLNADQINSPGGTITMVVAPPTGYQLTILRNVAATQGTQLPNQGGWYPQVVEKALDKLTMLVQQLSEKVSRSVQVGVTATDPSTLVASINNAAATSVAAAAAAGSSATVAAAAATSAGSSATAAAASAASLSFPAFAGNALKAIRANAAATAWEFFDAIAKTGGAMTGPLDQAKAADIPAAPTINLTTATGNFGHITGSGQTITAITIPVGAERTEIFDGANTLVHSAALLLPGAANITTAAGGRMIVRGDTAGANVVSYTHADGTPLVGGQYLKVSDQKSNGTSAGTSVNGVQTRTLNTVDTNEIAGASLGSNTITLPAGKYEVWARAPATNPGTSKLYLYNTTDSVFAIIGSSAWCLSLDATVDSVVTGKFTISTSKSYQLRQYIDTAIAGGLGKAASTGQVEVFTEAIFKKVA